MARVVSWMAVSIVSNFYKAQIFASFHHGKEDPFYPVLSLNKDIVYQRLNVILCWRFLKPNSPRGWGEFFAKKVTSNDNQKTNSGNLLKQ